MAFWARKQIALRHLRRSYLLEANDVGLVSENLGFGDRCGASSGANGEPLADPDQPISELIDGACRGLSEGRR